MTESFRIPRQMDLQSAYAALIHSHPAPPDYRALALYSQWSRFDPRLAELWVKFVWQHWRQVNPIDLHSSLTEQPWPAAAAVLLEFVERAAGGASQFKHWKGAVVDGFLPAGGEQFFIGLRKPGGKAMFEDARFSHSEYKKWGFLGRAIPFNKQVLPSDPEAPTHSVDRRTRLEIIRAMLERSKPITARTYREATGDVISIRQAERDLAGCRQLRAHGTTRGKYYTRAARQKRKRV